MSEGLFVPILIAEIGYSGKWCVLVHVVWDLFHHSCCYRTEIEVPPALDVDPNGSESPTGEPPMWTADEKVDRWNDLGLDQWVKDTA
ncbi:hypothetical protein GQ600_19405 [Phytophthora cactorum]|nr:hypothetical protein GQ600_19405 [Phytophthora cactorum]